MILNENCNSDLWFSFGVAVFNEKRNLGRSSTRTAKKVIIENHPKVAVLKENQFAVLVANQFYGTALCWSVTRKLPKKQLLRDGQGRARAALVRCHETLQLQPGHVMSNENAKFQIPHITYHQVQICLTYIL